MTNKQDKQILAWLEEENDGEEDETVPESDRESEHSDHCTDTEQSAAESDKDEPSTCRVSPVPTQESLLRGRSRGRGAGAAVIQNTQSITRSSTVTQVSRSLSLVSTSQRPSRRIQRGYD
ncbi:unnamed protein product [Danaus chrysippus]|uniref:(African queen) hypothetical protein n=1 Tax=Danaus chrysippus TaxID=151541 RepID=A0A8J2RAD8_9NEOP|nr:unnamed protein product [Danaus chrysippus]